ncbi:hypothetical protein PAP_08030 [Palaeococcus pacificus DY20341]|uniref:Uncharacterized protein n=1 Tax=Palaeococcus pacificus DY20341 TaxID=1343739 RepID=A0A075LUE8_9EURY|nr:hypothetical protein [Palaeococcus pacificus]AIF69994.1 hypothetical protein PAP_08030 [Palaeococcus pacificus DY20341]
MKKLIALLLILTIPFVSASWIRTFDAGGNEKVKDLEIYDGLYVVGYSEGHWAPFIMKFSINGSELWGLLIDEKGANLNDAIIAGDRIYAVGSLKGKVLIVELSKDGELLKGLVGDDGELLSIVSANESIFVSGNGEKAFIARLEDGGLEGVRVNWSTDVKIAPAENGLYAAFAFMNDWPFGLPSSEGVVAKLTFTLEPEWAVSIDGTPLSIASDGENAYIGGYAHEEAFLAKVMSNGNVSWALQFGGTWSWVNSVCVNGSIYAAGLYDYNEDYSMDPDGGMMTKVVGKVDGFLLMFGRDGEYLGGVAISGEGGENAEMVVVRDHIYLTGYAGSERAWFRDIMVEPVKFALHSRQIKITTMPFEMRLKNVSLKTAYPTNATRELSPAIIAGRAFGVEGFIAGIHPSELRVFRESTTTTLKNDITTKISTTKSETASIAYPEEERGAYSWLMLVLIVLLAVMLIRRRFIGR